MGISFKNIGKGLETLGKTVGNDFKQAGDAIGTAAKDLVTGKESQAGSAAVNGLKDVGDGFADGGAEAVGVAELLGAKYPVNTYQSKLDDNLTRGSRLSDEGIAQLHTQGYKSVINLCMENDDDTPRAKALGMNSLHLPILDNSAPSEAQVKQFLDFATNPANQPAYVHCEAGQGRTGVMSAAYRMAVDGWTPQAAIAEAKQMGMKLPDQLQFLQQFGNDLAAGKIAGYPVKQ
ncbi:MAG: dual specificity protein phosphatase family protein [Deltaproteobacteria bacterium]|nr:dual specificity protein phosphatase family protein [Deltaproteobacteria bacterium]